MNGFTHDVLSRCLKVMSAPSHAVVSVLSPFRHRPMLLWGLAGCKEGDRLVTTADQAGTSALRKPMEDLGLRFRFLYEVHDRPPRMERIAAYAKACRAARELEGAKVGRMGYRDMRLYGTMFDGVSLRSRIGIEVEFFEMLEMVQRAERAAKADVDGIVARIKREW
jgi:L-fucose isomerase-like protein